MLTQTTNVKPYVASQHQCSPDMTLQHVPGKLANCAGRNVCKPKLHASEFHHAALLAGSAPAKQQLSCWHSMSKGKLENKEDSHLDLIDWVVQLFQELSVSVTWSKDQYYVFIMSEQSRTNLQTITQGA